MDHARVCGRSESGVGVLWWCCGAASKPAPSPAARVRHPEKLGVRLGGVEGLATRPPKKVVSPVDDPHRAIPSCYPPYNLTLSSPHTTKTPLRATPIILINTYK